MKLTAGALTVLFFVLVRVASSKSDTKERILYDQRQEGDWNIRADLKNFVIVIVPKNTESSSELSSPGLLDLLSRSHPHKHHTKKVRDKNGNEAAAETMHFIESKTAPYHVDITKSSPSHLMKEEILATQSPPAALALKSVEEKPEEKEKAVRTLRSTRFANAFVLTVPEDDFVITEIEDDRKVVKNDNTKKKFIVKKNKEELTLLGADEQCGPDMVRDPQGVCRLRKVIDEAAD